MREKNYVNSYKLKHLEIYRYVLLAFLDLLLKRRRNLTLLVRIYEYQYSYAKT